MLTFCVTNLIAINLIAINCRFNSLSLLSFSKWLTSFSEFWLCKNSREREEKWTNVYYQWIMNSKSETNSLRNGNVWKKLASWYDCIWFVSYEYFTMILNPIVGWAKVNGPPTLSVKLIIYWLKNSPLKFQHQIWVKLLESREESRSTLCSFSILILKFWWWILMIT
jgi:hypothetical protein